MVFVEPRRPEHMVMKKMRALVLEKKGVLKIRESKVNDYLGPEDVRIKPHTVGICGSDAHYYEFGKIGDFVVNKPMIMGHEVSGTVIAVGENVINLRIGDRVCMEPGIPDCHSRQTLKGMYNLDPKISFYATPPVDGCMSETVIHPSSLTFKLPNNVSYAEGALIEPLAVGMHSCVLAAIKPGDVALVYGAGTIGLMTALCALNAGCSTVVVTDPVEGRLVTARKYKGIIPISTKDRDTIKKTIDQLTENEGAHVVFECSGAPPAVKDIPTFAAPGATVVLVGMPPDVCLFNTVGCQAKELTIKTVFRYRNVFPAAIRLMASGKIDFEPLITARFKFEDSIKAYERCCARNPTDIKLMITMSNEPDIKKTNKWAHL